MAKQAEPKPPDNDWASISESERRRRVAFLKSLPGWDEFYRQADEGEQIAKARPRQKGNRM